MAGRPEKPLAPDDGPVRRLAQELRELRVTAGSPTYQRMARESGYGASTLSQAAGGERLPSLPVLLAYAAACGGSPADWEQRWHRAVREATRQAPAAQDPRATPPYRGLKRFEPGDRDLFFGRTRLVARLVDAVAASRFVAVVGASGNGKSSLLRAGLIPALRSGEGTRPQAIRILTPGPRPAVTHGPLLEPLDGPGDTVVVVDQFEELYTLCGDVRERDAFLGALLDGTGPGGRLRVVIAVRADFFGRCAEHHRLAEALRDATLVVGPMGPAELREAVVRPAAAAGLVVERSLTARIVEETARQPGGLPLMSHALLETWRHRRGRVLTEEMYDAVGGLRGAIAATAEEVYAGLTPSQARGARRILLRLITPGEGAQDTRRPVPRGELETFSRRSSGVLERLVAARLVTVDDDTVDVAHEALITAWPRYGGWIEEDRERLRARRHLTGASRAWEELGQDPGALYRGSRLAAAEDVFLRDRLPGRPPELTPREFAFLSAGVRARTRETWSAARSSRRLRTLSAALTLLLVAASFAARVVWDQRANTAVEQQVLGADRLAARSDDLLATDPGAASLLAVQAYRTRATPQAVASLDDSAASAFRGGFQVNGAVGALAFGPGQDDLAIAGADGVWLRGPQDRSARALSGSGRGLGSVAFSPDGDTLVAGGRAGVRRWDLAAGQTVGSALGGPGPVAFGPGGHTLVAGTAGRSGVRLIGSATGRTVRVVGGAGVGAVAVSHDGRLLATAGSTGLRLWDAATGTLRSVLDPADSGADASLAFSPDGDLLAAGGGDDGAAARLWNTSDGRLQATPGPTGGGRAVAFSPDGLTLAVGGDTGVQLWDVLSGRPRGTLAAGAPVTAVAFAPDGRTLATGDDTGAVRLWNPGTGLVRALLTGTGDGPTAFGADGRLLATDGRGAGVLLWDTATNRGRSLPQVLPPAAPMAFAPDGRTLATADGPTVGLWDVRDSRRLRDLTATGRVSALVFAPRGHTLAVRCTTGGSTRVELWNRDTGRAIRVITSGGQAGVPVFGGDDLLAVALRGPGASDSVKVFDASNGDLVQSLRTPCAVDSVVFSPDGTFLAAGGPGDCPVSVWDTTSLNPPDPRVLYPQGQGGSLHFSPDGQALIDVGDAVVLWNTSGWRSHDLGGVGAVRTAVFAPAGGTLAVAGEGGVALWNTDTDEALTAPVTGSTDLAAFSPDGGTLATATTGSGVRLWDVATGHLRTALVDSADVRWMEFAPDGRTLVTKDGNDPIQLWNVALPDPGTAVREICAIVADDPALLHRSLVLPGGPVCPR